MVSLRTYARKTKSVSPAGARTTAWNQGITRITAVILVAAVVVTVLTAVPFVIRWREESATFNCSLSVEKMQDLVDTEVIFRQRNMTSAETTAFLEAYDEMGEILCMIIGYSGNAGAGTDNLFCCELLV